MGKRSRITLRHIIRKARKDHEDEIELNRLVFDKETGERPKQVGSPLDILPVEILRHIMVLADEEPDNPYEIACGLGSSMACTSRRLRDIAVGTASLWTHISNAFTLAEIFRRLDRSKREHLKVDYWIQKGSFDKIKITMYLFLEQRKVRGFGIDEIRFKAPFDGSLDGKIRFGWCRQMRIMTCWLVFNWVRKVKFYDSYGTRLDDNSTVPSDYRPEADWIPDREFLAWKKSLASKGGECFNFPELFWHMANVQEMSYNYCLPGSFAYITQFKHITTFNFVLRGEPIELIRLEMLLPNLPALEYLNMKLGGANFNDTMALSELGEDYRAIEQFKLEKLKKLSLQALIAQAIPFLDRLIAPNLKRLKVKMIDCYDDADKASVMTKYAGQLASSFTHSMRKDSNSGKLGLYFVLDAPLRRGWTLKSGRNLSKSGSLDDHLKAVLDPILPASDLNLTAKTAVLRQRDSIFTKTKRFYLRFSFLVTDRPIASDVLEICTGKSTDEYLIRHAIECSRCNGCM